MVGILVNFDFMGLGVCVFLGGMGGVGVGVGCKLAWYRHVCIFSFVGMAVGLLSKGVWTVFYFW